MGGGGLNGVGGGGGGDAPGGFATAGAFGGGGGGGGPNGTTSGARGGFGGGGGSGVGAHTGGDGGFGGGGGALAPGGFGGGGGFGAPGGFAGGAGSTSAASNGSGGGGALGGAIFVAAGGSLTVDGATAEVGASVTGGIAGGAGSGTGSAYGGGIFFQGTSGTASTLTFGSGTQFLADPVADQNGTGGASVSNGLGGTGGSTAVLKTGGGILNLQAANSYTGGTTIANGTVVLGTATSAGSGPITFATTGTTTATLALTTAAQPSGRFFADTLDGFGTNDGLDLAGLAYGGSTSASYNAGTHTLIVSAGASSELFKLSGETPGASGLFYAHSDGAGGTLIDNQAAVCFASGTRIRTVRDEVAVEDLAVGDFVVTTSGALRAIRWLGHRTVDCRNHPDPRQAWPIRVAAHAFGDNRPARDLYVSPGHSICLDIVGEVLIPASALVNGSTVTQVEVEDVTYWHVELEAHDILLANGLPAESYLDMGNRGFFAEGDVVTLDASPDADPAQRTHADFCRQFHSGGALVEVVKAQLRAQALKFGWSLSDTLDLHLMVDGHRVDPVLRGLTARFHVPVDADDVWLVSPTARPCDTMGEPDNRDLGLCVASLRIEDGLVAPRDIALGDPLLCIGFHDVEDGCRRWTAGRARVPAGLWHGCEDGFYLRVELVGAPVPRWVAPAVEAKATMVEVVCPRRRLAPDSFRRKAERVSNISDMRAEAL